MLPGPDLVVIPTYCEYASLPGVLQRLHAASPMTEVLVVDDNSPDGTGQWVEEAKSGFPWLYLLQRGRKDGIGRAYLDGFAWALERNYQIIGQMDADGSHLPEQYPRLRQRLCLPDQPGGVVGSRYRKGGATPGWSWQRRMLSRLGNGYWRLASGLALTDITSGYRVYRAEQLAPALCQINQFGYGFQAQMTQVLLSDGAGLAEVPITFVDRQSGDSKMAFTDAWEQWLFATQTWLRGY